MPALLTSPEISASLIAAILTFVGALLGLLSRRRQSREEDLANHLERRFAEVRTRLQEAIRYASLYGLANKAIVFGQFIVGVVLTSSFVTL
jgi:hypothetical protein